MHTAGQHIMRDVLGKERQPLTLEAHGEICHGSLLDQS
jgi:hypothetical protein